MLWQALGWGAWALLLGGAEADRRALRAACRELRAASDDLIDTLTIQLERATCSDPAVPQAMAAFHRCHAPVRARVLRQRQRGCR